MKLNDTATVRELSDVLVEICTDGLPKCGEITPTVFLRHDDKVDVGVLADGVCDDVLAQVDTLATGLGCHLIGATMEAWTAKYDKDHDTSVAPSKRDDKQEVVVIGVGDRKGDVLVRMFAIDRDGDGKPSLGAEVEGDTKAFGGRVYNLLAGGEPTKH